MGVKGFLYMLKKQYTTVLLPSKPQNVEILLIDGNCILHEVVANFSHLMDPQISEIIKAIVNTFNDILSEYNSKFVYICLDGIPPLPKQLCQKRRRCNNFSLSAFLLPGTTIMNRIENILINYFQSDKVTIISTNIIGEGEQKLFQFLKKYEKIHQTSLPYVFITHDSDIIILSMMYIEACLNLPPHIIVIIPTFKFSVDISLLHSCFKKKDLLHRLLWACVLCGNDFFPPFYRIKHMKTLEIFTMLIKNKTLQHFQDFSIESICTCNNEDAESYVTLWRWFKNYFTTNSFTSVDPYLSENSPCTACISKVHEFPVELLQSSRKHNQITQISLENHLSYVLTEDHKTSSYF